MSKPRWQDVSEAWARETVAQVLGANVVPHDGVAPGDSLYDFHIIRRSRVDALEVTMARIRRPSSCLG